MCVVTQTLTRSGSRLLARGFRPFFLATAACSLAVVALWMLVLPGWLDWRSALDPMLWHAHEMLFGAIGAAIAGFLLTAVPNWTGRLPVAGRRLAVLATLWLLPRLLWPLPGTLAPTAAAIVGFAFWALLLATVGREILVAAERRNLPVLAALTLVLAAEAAFSLGFLLDDWPLQRGANLAMLALAVLLVSLIGGRILPSFTGNWLAKRGARRRPRRTAALDAASLALSAAGLALWIGALAEPAGVLLCAAALAQLVRLALWRGWATFAEPLVAVLHLAYLWIPVGLGLLGAAQLWPEQVSESAALHALGGGALGGMVMAVTTRATLGHSGQPLQASGWTAAIYVAVLLAALLRVLAAELPDGLAVGGLSLGTGSLLGLAALLWSAAQLGFLWRFGPLLLGLRGQPG